MVITDFEDLEYIEQFKARNEDARIPNTILLRSQENASELKTSELESIRRKLDGEDVMIKLRPTV